MNIQEYISSGILEAYALGELHAEERAAVEKNLLLYPELNDELARVQETQEEFLLRSSIQPRAHVKQSLLNRLDTKEAPVVAINRNGAPLTVWRVAATVALAATLISSYLAYNFYSRWKASEASLSQVLALNQRLAQDYNQVNQRLDKIEDHLGVTTNPAFQRVMLKGTDNAPNALAVVYWNTSSHEIYLSVQNMKEIARESQFQLWAIIDGKPVDAGVFDVQNGDGLLKMKTVGDHVSMFAVTIEPRGGKASPSLETMQVAGSVGA